MNIYVAADHRGFERKELLKEHLKKAGLKFVYGQKSNQKNHLASIPHYCL
jgi:ribose 5-phosphate isomerase RpiB